MTHGTFVSFGAVLKGFRTRRELTQQILAEKLGVRRNTIGSWERGDFLPQSKGVVLELAKHLDLDDEEIRQLLEASLTLAPYWLVPLRRNPYFTGREEILETIHRQLSFDQTIALTQSSALHGLGGVGKTQIALEYAYRHALEYSAVFWIGAETDEQVVASFQNIAGTLQLPEWQNADQRRMISAVQRWLNMHRQWLLIWDNVEDLDILHRFLPFARSGAILITTRCLALGTLARGLDLLPMERAESILFLLRRAKVLALEAMNEPVRQFAERFPIQYQAAAELAEMLGGLPLALDQAGAYLEETHSGLPAYLDLFRTRRDVLLQRRGEGVQDHPASVSTTFTLAIAAAAGCHPAVRELLQVCALLQPDAIPEELFLLGGTHLGSRLETTCRDPLEWDRVVGMACSYSLLLRQPETQTLSMHRLVQAVLLDDMTEAERAQWTWRVIVALDAILSEELGATEYTTWKQRERLLPHALLCLHRAEAFEESLTFASLVYKVAQYLRTRGRYGEAERLHQHALHIRERLLGPDHPDVASSLNSLAVLSREQGKYEEAELLYQRALRIRKDTLGPEHALVAASLNNLANLYYNQGKYAEAEPLYQRALHIREDVLGPAHPQVALSLSNLAVLSYHQGKYAEAEALCQRALRIQEDVLGPEHPDVAFPLTSLAELSREQGRYAEAETLYQRAISIWEKQLGPEHPNVAHPLTSLAELFLEQGRYAEAETLYQRAISIWEKQLGPEHPNVAHSLHGLANLYQKRGKYKQAEQLYRRSLCIREQHLDPHHPLTAQTLHDWAVFQQQQGNLKEAIALAERALSIRTQSLGDAHPKTVATHLLHAQLARQQAAGTEPTLEHLRILLKARGWSLHLKKQRGKSHVYATRKAGQYTHSHYLAPLGNLAACLAAASTLPNAKEE